MKSPIPSLTTRIAMTSFLLTCLAAGNASAGCGATTFSPVGPFIPNGTTHNAYFLTDPANQQRAVFDLVWGGALASLKYNNVERVWGSNPGAMVQTAWHALSPDYNPTQAGDVGGAFHGSTVLGIRCVNSNTLTIYTSMLDFNQNLSGGAPFQAVKNNAVASNTYVTPYIIVSTATFVANGSAPPAYYLKLEQTITNISSTESHPWGFEFANYVPGNYIYDARHPAACNALNSCQSSSTPDIVAGMYPNAQLTNGVAFFHSPQTNWAPGTTAWSELKNSPGAFAGISREVHLWNAYWGLAPGTQRTQTWYVLAGDWQKALNFALTH
jgi:hypothetical protein